MVMPSSAAFLPSLLHFPSSSCTFFRSFRPSICSTRSNRSPLLYVNYIVSQQSTTDDDSINDFVSDTTHVVLDSRDIPAVLDRLNAAGDEMETFFDDFLHHAENLVDAKSTPPTDTTPSPNRAPHPSDNQAQTVDYFRSEYLPYLPRWAREAFHADDTMSICSPHPLTHRQRLRDIAEQPAGITDCLISHVAEDYHVPIEFVIDAILALGVESPITVNDSVKDTLNDKQVTELLRLLSTFDAVDLADRYSDRSVKEMADDYDLHLDDVIQTCENEGFHMCLGPDTRLSLIQEDRVLDILLKGAPSGTPYPSPLDGLS